jgi:membrane AbrB-like protein
MTNGINLMLYLGVGIIGGLAGFKWRFPGSILIGSMLAVLIVKIVLKSNWSVQNSFSVGIQILLGVLIGSRYTPELGHTFARIAIPAICSTVVLVIVGLVVALALAKIGILDIPTAYLSTSPGAMTALLTLSLDSPANTGIVAAFHFFRLLFIMLTAPVVYSLMQSLLKRF